MEKTNKLTFAQIDAMPPADRYKVYGDSVVKPFSAITTAREKASDGIQTAAKVTASLKRYHVECLAKRVFTDTSEKQFFGTHAGGVPPARVLAIATFFNAMCLTLVNGKPLLLETHFDVASGNSLELAAAAIAHERKNLPDAWMGTDNTLDIVNALSTPGDATKKIKEVRKRQKPAKSGDGEADTLTNEQAIAFLKESIKNAKPDDSGYGLYAALVELNDAWAEATEVTDQVQGEWASRYDAQKTAELNAAETPAQQPAEPAAA